MELSDRLSDALQFEGGTHEDGPPPESSTGVSSPQISDIEGPEKLQIGADFAVNIVSSFSPPEDVSKAIVHVGGASGHIVVTGHLVDSFMTLAGTLGADENLKGIDVVVRFALQTSGGITGEYKDLSVSVSTLDEEEVSDPTSMMDFEDSLSFDTGRPEGSSTDEAPQITVIEAPETVNPKDDITVKLRSDYTNEVDAAVLTVPNSDGYTLIFEDYDTTKGVMTIKMSLTGLPRKSDGGAKGGDTFTFLWALRSLGTQQVGLYRAWMLTLESTSQVPDGDHDPDPDPEPEPEPEPDPEAELPSVSEQVGVDGGVVEHPNGAAVNIPQGALDEWIEITIEQTGIIPGEIESVGPVFRFGPEGQQFNSPVSITLPCDEGDLGALTGYWTAQGDESVWVDVGGESAGEGLWRVSVSHFSLGTVGLSVAPDGDEDIEPEPEPEGRVFRNLSFVPTGGASVSPGFSFSFSLGAPFTAAPSESANYVMKLNSIVLESD